MVISREMQILAGVLVAVGSYLIGNINSAILISKLKGKDIRKCGSGNPGTMNMLRSLGKPLGALTFVLDILKGVVPCLLGWLFMGDGEFLRLGGERMGMYVGGLSVTLGHIYPVFYKFKGGKGAATIVGVCLTMQPLYALGFVAAGIAFLFFAKIGSLTSFIIISAPLTVEGVRAASQSMPMLCTVLLFAMFALSLFAHRKNVVKLFSGNEGRVVLKKSKKHKPAPDRSIRFDAVTVAE